MERDFQAGTRPGRDPEEAAAAAGAANRATVVGMVHDDAACLGLEWFSACCALHGCVVCHPGKPLLRWTGDVCGRVFEKDFIKIDLIQ